ncbi:MAG: hypothetical protein WBG70_14770 [Spirulinaceae cyanobacterium]
MEYINTSIAAQILGVGQRRVLYLLHQKRIKGAYKKQRSWVIPLYRGKPKISRTHKGPLPRWSKLGAGKKKIIYVNKNHIKDNETRIKEKGPNTPLKTVVSVKGSSNRTIRGHELEIHGRCRIDYCAGRPRDCGAVLWIETYSHVEVIDKSNPEQWSIHHC